HLRAASEQPLSTASVPVDETSLAASFRRKYAQDGIHAGLQEASGRPSPTLRAKGHCGRYRRGGRYPRAQQSGPLEPPEPQARPPPRPPCRPRSRVAGLTTMPGPEFALVEKPAIDVLKGLGYAYLPKHQAEPQRDGLNQVFLRHEFIAAVQRLN